LASTGQVWHGRRYHRAVTITPVLIESNAIARPSPVTVGARIALLAGTAAALVISRELPEPWFVVAMIPLGVALFMQVNRLVPERLEALDLELPPAGMLDDLAIDVVRIDDVATIEIPIARGPVSGAPVVAGPVSAEVERSA